MLQEALLPKASACACLWCQRQSLPAQAHAAMGGPAAQGKCMRVPVVPEAKPARQSACRYGKPCCQRQVHARVSGASSKACPPRPHVVRRACMPPACLRARNEAQDSHGSPRPAATPSARPTAASKGQQRARLPPAPAAWVGARQRAGGGTAENA